MKQTFPFVPGLRSRRLARLWCIVLVVNAGYVQPLQAQTTPTQSPGAAATQTPVRTPAQPSAQPSNQSGAQAPVQVPASALKPTLPNQLQSMVERAATQEDFRIIRNTALLQFQANLVDSLGRMRKEQAQQKAQLANVEVRLKKTEELLTQAEASYQEISTRRDSMSLLGLPVSKATYQSIMGILIAVFAALAGFFYFRFRSRNGVTSKVEKLLQETQEEFEQYKKRAIEREQKLKRELQDELNKRS
jgi:hypothetical protein